MLYTDFSALPWTRLSAPLAAAEDALARLDATLAPSPLRPGWIARSHFADATASLWLDGHLVPAEDLVLHDARMDVRPPTHELTRAHTILRARRRIFDAAPDWALSRAGLEVLRGRSGRPVPGIASQPDAGGAADEEIDLDADRDEVEPDDDPLAAELAALDALIARSTRTLAGGPPPRPEPDPKTLPLYDCDWDEDARLEEWSAAVAQTASLPPVLAAALALHAWETIEPLQHSPWLGRLLAASLLRDRHKTRAHLVCLNTGFKLIPRERRTSRDPTIRLIAGLDALRLGAEAGLNDHARWTLSHTLLARQLAGRRGTSKLPQLIDLVMARPLVSAGLIAAELGISARAAQTLVRDLGLREMTGRRRYRAWGVL